MFMRKFIKNVLLLASLLSPLWMFIKSFQKAPFLGPHPLFIRHYYRMNRKMAESWWGWKKNGRQLCLISERDAVQSGLNILKIVQFKGVAKINVKGQWNSAPLAILPDFAQHLCQRSAILLSIMRFI